MQGDDWLNNASTRDVFGRYVEGLLETDAREQLRTLESNCEQRRIGYKSVMRSGDPTQCLIETAQQEQADWVVIGPPRPKGMEGYRSGMDLKQLVRALRVPLTVANRSE